VEVGRYKARKNYIGGKRENKIINFESWKMTPIKQIRKLEMSSLWKFERWGRAYLYVSSAHGSATSGIPIM